MARRRSLHVERLEQYFMLVSFGFLIVAIVLLVLVVAQGHAQLPEPAGRIDPNEVDTTPPFDAPGLYATGEGTYDLVLTAQAWQWNPTEVEIPRGAEVTFLITSKDVVHGIRVPDTNINAMVIPGQITEVAATFEETGAFTLLCHEYCGTGHHTMGAIIRVVEPGELDLAAPVTNGSARTDELEEAGS